MRDVSSHQAWLRAMPVVFVGIWSTGFIVARFGMPHSPPFTFLAWRYAFSILCFVPWVIWRVCLGLWGVRNGNIWRSRVC